MLIGYHRRGAPPTGRVANRRNRVTRCPHDRGIPTPGTRERGRGDWQRGPLLSKERGPIHTRSAVVLMPDYPKRIVSGGQTGADQGGLAAAIKLGIPHGGWCPKGRRAEGGKVPARYDLKETASANYQARTRRNVIDSDGTVILTRGRLEGGSLLTARVAREVGKPCLHLTMQQLGGDRANAVARFRAWLAAHRIETLNVAGSRASKAKGIQDVVKAFLCEALGSRQQYAVEHDRAATNPSPALAADGGGAVYEVRRKNSPPGDT